MTRVFRNQKLHTGDIVANIEDERHVGRVEAIRSGAFVTVKWLDSGWVTELPVERVKRVEKS